MVLSSRDIGYLIWMAKILYKNTVIKWLGGACSDERSGLLVCGLFVYKRQSPVFVVRHYVTADARNPFLEWIKKLRDPLAKGRVLKRINRIEGGNFGDHKRCRDGVWELRIDHGPGYRVYYAMAGAVVVLLLCGGDKRSQDADIERAIAHWKDWQRRPP